MKKQNGILIPLLAIGVVLVLGYKGFGWENNLKDTEFAGIINFTTEYNSPKTEAWQVFEKYLEFARTHNLEGLKMLSYQISATCADATKREECFALMDSIYAIASGLKLEDFKNIQSDERQIIMYTDGPAVAILFFTRDGKGTPKLLGLSYCFEDANTIGSCVKTDLVKRDQNSNGWWDIVEALFY